MVLIACSTLCFMTIATTEALANSHGKTILPPIKQILSDRIEGDPSAPITMIEYASMTCPHCAEFHTGAYKLIKKEYVETGKVKFIYRDFPLDRLGLAAAMMARCAPKERYFAIVNIIYHTNFNGILINKYLNGNDYISAHSDSESNCDVNGVVAISYGSTRKFRIRDKKTKTIVGDFPLNHAEMLIMGGDFQKEFTHEIPIEKKIKEPRISFTFRKHEK